jgi:hypothetical protein
MKRLYAAFGELIHQDAKILLKILKIHQQRNKASL